MDTEEDNLTHGVEQEMVWPSSNAEDQSRSILDSERAKYLRVAESSLILFSWQGLLEKAHWVFEFFFRPCTSNSIEGLRESPDLPSEVIPEEPVAVEGYGQVVEPEDNEMSSESEGDVMEAVADKPAESASVTTSETTAKSYVSKAEVTMVRRDADETGNEQVEERNDTEHFDDCLTWVPDSEIEVEDDENNKEVTSQSEELSTNDMLEKGDDSEVNQAGEEYDSLITNTVIEQEYETSGQQGVEIIEEKRDVTETFTMASEDLNETNESSQQIPEIEVTEDFEGENDFEKVDKDLQFVNDELAEMKVDERTSDGIPIDEVTKQQSSDLSSSSSSDAEDSVDITAEAKEEHTSIIAIATDDDADRKILDESVKIDERVETSTSIVEEQEEAPGVSESHIEAEVVQIEPDTKVDELEVVADSEKEREVGRAIEAEEIKEEEIERSATELSVPIPIISVTDVTASDQSSDKANESISTTDDKASELESFSSSSTRSKKSDKMMKVDNATKRIFKRKVKSYIKHVVKARDLPSFKKNDAEGPIITPTVLRVGTDEKTSLTLKKTELSRSKSSSLGRLSSSKEEEFVRLVSLTGFEGYGKTILMKRYADMASGKVMNVNELTETGVKRWHPFARKDVFKFVHYIDLRDLPTEGEYTVDELLFQILIKDLTPNEAEVGYRWLQVYKKSMLFIIDSVNDLDVFPEEVRRHVAYSEKASPQAIMYNLLTGNILPKAHVLMSSSVMNATHITDALSPDRVYVLSGFDRNDIKTYLAKNAKVFKILTDGAYDNLFASSKVPLGMFYSSNALRDDEYRLDSLLSAISHYVRTAVKGGKQATTQSNEILSKLKRASFQCSLQGDEVIQESVSSMSLSSKDLSDCRLFVEKSLGRIEADETMIRWIKTFTFGHVTIREYLSALHLAEADMDAFTKFTNENFGTAGFDFQQKSLYGLLFSYANLEYAKDLVTVSNLKEKRNLLRQVLLKRLQSKSPSFYIYTIIHESPDGIDDIVKENLRTLSIVGDKLTTVAMFILSCVASRVGSLDELELRRCYPNDDVLRRFLSSAKHDETTVKILNLRENPGILTCGSSVREICQNCKVEELDFGACNFRGDVLAALPRILRDVELKALRIDDNPEISENSLHGVGEFIKKTNVKSLGIGNTDLNETKLQRFERAVKTFQFDSLDLRKNREIGTQKAISIVGNISSECKLQNVNMAFCGVLSKHCQSFKESLKGHKIKKLDISALEPIDVSLDDLNDLSDLLPFIEEELRIENWQFSLGALTLFTEKVQTSGLKNVKIFYGSNEECISNANLASEI